MKINARKNQYGNQIAAILHFNNNQLRLLNKALITKESDSVNCDDSEIVRRNTACALDIVHVTEAKVETDKNVITLSFPAKGMLWGT